jgi:hypothetical protein
MGTGAVVSVILKGLKDNSTPKLDEIAAAVYHAMWCPSNICQLDFAVFGREILVETKFRRRSTMFLSIVSMVRMRSLEIEVRVQNPIY